MRKSKSLRAYKRILEEPEIKLMSFDFKTRHLPTKYSVPLLMQLEATSKMLSLGSESSEKEGIDVSESICQVG